MRWRCDEWIDKMIESALTIFFLWLEALNLQSTFLFHYCFGNRLSFYFDFLCEFSKAFMNIFPIFGTDLEKLHSMFFCQDISLFKSNLPLIFKVILGANQYFTNVFWRISFYLFDPIGNVAIGAVVCDGISQDYACCSFVISLSNVLKTLLTGCVPYLHFDPFLIDLEHFDLEIDPNGRYIAVLEHSFAEVGEQIGLPNSTVSNDDDFKQHIWHHIPFSSSRHLEFGIVIFWF